MRESPALRAAPSSEVTGQHRPTDQIAAPGAAGNATALTAKTPGVEPQEEPLDESRRRLSMGRSTTFRYPQWRSWDEYRSVYFDVGRGDPIVFVHGLGGNLTHFEHLIPFLEKRHRILGLDLPGFGASLKPRQPYTLELLTRQLLHFVRSRGIGPATLVGHSLGGAVCLDLATRFPGLVRSLVLLGSAGVAPFRPWMRRLAPFFLHRPVLFPFLLFGHRWILRHVFVERATANPFVAHFHRMALHDDLGLPNFRAFVRVSASLCRDLVERDFSDAIPGLGIPLLAIWGEADQLTPLPDIAASLARAARARLVVLGRCGHMPMIERPHDVLYHLERFLRDPPDRCEVAAVAGHDGRHGELD